MSRPCWHIQLFGGLQCRRGETVIERFRTRKAASLLAYLALYADRAHPREELLDLFWPEMDEEAARTNLRQALSSLRRALETDSDEPVLISDNASIKLASGSFATDVAEFEEALRMAETDSRAIAIDLYKGELLAGFYDEWIFPERRRLESLYLNALHEIQASLSRDGRADSAIPYALRAVQVDPCNEETHLALMRLHAAMGDSASVLRQMDQLRSSLEEELGERPSEETVRLAGSLVEEAKANEPIIARLQWESRPARPLWKRLLAMGTACVALFAMVFSPLVRSPRSQASDRSSSPEDRQIAELHELRTGKFETGTSSERIAARRQHAAICVDLAEKAWSCWYGRGEETWLRRFTESNEEIRTGLRWLLDNDPERALLLSGDLTRFWYVRSFPREGYRWLSESLARAPRSRTVARARALVGAAFLSPVYGKIAEGQIREAEAIFHERGDRWGEAHAIRHLGFLAASRTEAALANKHYERALDEFTRLSDERGRAVTLLCLSFASSSDGGVSHSRAQLCAAQSLELFRKLQNPWGVSMSLHSMGVLEENREKAKALIQQAADAYPEANGLSEKECEEHAIMAARTGDLSKAREWLSRELQIARDRNNRMGVAYALELLMTYANPNDVRAAGIFGATHALNNQLGIVNGPRMVNIEKFLISRLGRSRFESASQEGRRWSWEKAVDEASALN